MGEDDARGCWTDLGVCGNDARGWPGGVCVVRDEGVRGEHPQILARRDPYC